VDAEAIGMAQRLLRGIEARPESLAVEMFAKAGLAGEFLKLKETRDLFRSEQHLPSAVIDRGSLRAWEEAGSRDTYDRARSRVAELLASYKRPVLPAGTEREMRDVVERQAKLAGMERLPAL
jgi:trimethylamine--corrinoid protein Co-methyltransferase